MSPGGRKKETRPRFFCVFPKSTFWVMNSPTRAVTTIVYLAEYKARRKAELRKRKKGALHPLDCRRIFKTLRNSAEGEGIEGKKG